MAQSAAPSSKNAVASVIQGRPPCECCSSSYHGPCPFTAIKPQEQDSECPLCAEVHLTNLDGTDPEAEKLECLEYQIKRLYTSHFDRTKSPSPTARQQARRKSKADAKNLAIYKDLVMGLSGTNAVATLLSKFNKRRQWLALDFSWNTVGKGMLIEMEIAARSGDEERIAKVKKDFDKAGREMENRVNSAFHDAKIDVVEAAEQGIKRLLDILVKEVPADLITVEERGEAAK